MTENFDSSIFSKFQEGDRKVFASLFNSYYPMLVVYANRFIESQEDREDIATEAFTRLFEHRHRITGVQHIVAFLLVSTKNGCLNYLKSKKSRVVRNLEFAELLQDKDLTIYEYMIRAEIVKSIHEAIENLPPECGRIFKMLFYEELKPADVATMLKISVNTVYAQKKRAIDILRLEVSPGLLFIALLLRIIRLLQIFLLDTVLLRKYF